MQLPAKPDVVLDLQYFLGKNNKNTKKLGGLTALLLVWSFLGVLVGAVLPAATRGSICKVRSLAVAPAQLEED